MKKLICRKIGVFIPIFILALVISQSLGSSYVEAATSGEGYFSSRVIIGDLETYPLYLSGDPILAEAKTGIYWDDEIATNPHIDAVEFYGSTGRPGIYFSAGDVGGSQHGYYEIQAVETRFRGSAVIGGGGVAGNLIISDGDVLIGGPAGGSKICLNDDGVLPNDECITDWSGISGDSIWADNGTYIYAIPVGDLNDADGGMGFNYDGSLITTSNIYQTTAGTYLQNTMGDLSVEDNLVPTAGDSYFLGADGNRWTEVNSIEGDFTGNVLVGGGQNFTDTNPGDVNGVITWGGLDLNNAHIDYANNNIYIASPGGTGAVELQGNAKIAGNAGLTEPKLFMGDAANVGKVCLYGSGIEDCQNEWPSGIGGGGAVGRLAMFTPDTTTIGESVIYQLSYDDPGDSTTKQLIGIDDASPQAKLELR
ncbi:hypothetical protein KKI23_00835, partial [Patescibacteria group bacterium]|nr:hypothetical protein [Patescibacteria group bacterium]